MSQEAIDAIRIAHLLFFAMGMGSGLYFDLRALGRIGQPFSTSDIAEFHRVHRFVFWALVGLWATGVALIYIRTGFDLAEFSPKMMAKLGIVTLLTVNAVVIGRTVLPLVARHKDMAAIDMPFRALLSMTTVTAISMSAWVSGLMLGASVALKTADWLTLEVVLGGVFALIIFGSLCVVMALRALRGPSEAAAYSERG